ncbi:MAG: MlaD family protein [Nonlabens sp.]|nr:MlaD family protein [Nonlabens sp.]
MKFSKEVKVGLLTVSAIALFIFGYQFLKGRNLFKNDRKFYAVDENVEGLAKSAPVTINGLKVGNIDDIDFLDSSGRLLVTFHVDESFTFSAESMASVYSTSLIGGKALAILPDFKSASRRMAKSGDTLRSAVDDGLQGKVMEEFLPLKDKIENMIVSADSVMTDLHKIMNPNTRRSIESGLTEMNKTLISLQGLSANANSLITTNRKSLDRTITNLDKTSTNFAAMSDELAKVEIANVVQELETSIAKFNGVLDDVSSGKGSLGKLMTDDKLYENLERTTRQAEMLMQDIKLNPKRYVHFSVFGKKPGEYDKPEDRDK